MKNQEDDIIASTFAELAFFLVFVFAFIAVAFSEENGVNGDRIAFLKTKGKMSCFYEALDGLASVPKIDPEGLPLFSGSTPPRLEERGVIAIHWDEQADRFALRDNLVTNANPTPIPLNGKVPAAYTTLRTRLVGSGALNANPSIGISVPTNALHGFLQNASNAASQQGAECAMHIRWINRDLVEKKMLAGHEQARNAYFQMLRIDKLMPSA